MPISVLAQNVVSGVVLDKVTGQPLPGVNVVIQGADNGTSTDFDGKYKLGNLKKGDKIAFSFIGYKSATVDYSNQSTVNLSLEEDLSQLQEVVIQVGYGTVKKKDATGSVTTLTTKEFNKGTNVTAENLLNGRVAGLTVNTSGAPGSGSQIRIRGGSSLGASNDPLIVIDGLPIDNSTSVGSTSILSSINPSTIESMTVLKDASATAIYGSRASNGVIIITTKKGGKQLEVDYNYQLGIGKKSGQIDVFSADEFRNLVQVRENQLIASDAGLPVGFLTSKLGTANTNWQDEIYRTAEMVDQSVSLKGSLFKAIPTRLSIGRTYQEGLRLTNKFLRNNVSLAMNPSFLDNHLKLRLNANYSNENNRFAEGVEGTALRFDPTQPVRDANSPFGGFFEYVAANGELLSQSARNPVAQLLMRNDTGKYNRLFGNFELDYKLHFFPDLRAVVNVGFDESKGQRFTTIPNNSAVGFANFANIILGNKEYSEENKKNKLFDGYLVYNKTISEVKLEATAGYSYQKFERERSFTGNDFNPNDASDVVTYGDRVLVSFFGRTNIALQDKYLLTLTYRRDGSSLFSEANRWGNFPSAAFAWKLKEESFLKDSKVFSDLKLRLGWGVTGQQDLGDDANFLYLEPYSTGDVNSQYIFGPTPTPVGLPTFRNVDIKWEQTTTYNAGLDFGFSNNRFTGSVDVFYKQTKDLLSYAAISDGSNFSNAGFQNIGSLNIKGIEFTLNAEVVKSNNFNWNVNFNASKFERRIDKLALGADILTGGIGGGTGGTIQVHSEGYTPNSFYVFKQLYDVDNNPIQGAFADINGDGIVNDNDRYIKYNSDPDATFGFASNMYYKNFDFSFNLRASVGNHNYNNINSVSAYYSQINGTAVLSNVPKAILDTNFIEAGSLETQSDIYVEDASFLRMDNITLGYTFPKWLEGKASVRLSAGIQNAFVLTNYGGLDPEITNNGIDNTIYPRPRTLLFGANIKF